MVYVLSFQFLVFWEKLTRCLGYRNLFWAQINSPVETEGRVPRLHMAIHFQTLKAVTQNNSYKKVSKSVHRGGYSHNQVQYDSDIAYACYIYLDLNLFFTLQIFLQHCCIGFSN